MEQLNIVGKRSGNGFVAHRATLVYALQRVLADRLVLLDFNIGRKGFLAYLKALAGSNVVKIVPAGDSASVERAIGKRLKVICGANTSYLVDMTWIGDTTPMTFSEVRVSPNNAVKPNIGNVELAEALNRTLTFTATEDNRPVLQCVLFTAGEGKLKLVSADGFRLAVQSIDYDGEGQALIRRDDLAGIANALRKARRVNVGFEQSGAKMLTTKVVINTEAIKYTFQSAEGSYPDWPKLIPTEAVTTIHFDTLEAIKAVSSLKVLADSKEFPIDIATSDGAIILSNPDDKGQAIVPADIEGEANRVRVDGKFLADAFRACNGMVDLSVKDGNSPILFTVDGYQLVTMPMLVAGEKGKTEAKKTEAKAEAEGKTEAKAEAEGKAEAKGKTEAEATEKPDKSPKKVKEPVKVA